MFLLEVYPKAHLPILWLIFFIQGEITEESLTHLCQVDPLTSTLWTGPFPIEGVSGLFLLFPCFIESPVITAM